MATIKKQKVAAGTSHTKKATAKKRMVKTAVATKKVIQKKVAVKRPEAVKKLEHVKPVKKVQALKKLPSAKQTVAVSKPAKSPTRTLPASRLRSLTPAEMKKRFSKSDLKQFMMDLLALRERVADQSGSMRNAALQRDDEINVEEDGTDAFMRLQTLEQVSTQQAMVAKINEALVSIEKGTYGACEMCGDLITKARLAVLPFARTCIKCQSEMERPGRHGGKHR